MVRVRTSLTAGALLLGGLGGASCGVDAGAVPPGKIAVVGDVVLGPEDLAGVRAQLGAYAQLRFGGAEGDPTMLQALIAAELMAQQADAEGLGEDPRVAYALHQEVAAVYLAAQLERAVPRASVAADEAALRAYYDAHLEDFMAPERRNIEGLYFPSVVEAEAALVDLRAGTQTLAGNDAVVSTALAERDDAENPGFHPLLFDPALSAGDWLSHPVLIGTVFIAARVQQIERSQPRPFEDPAVQEQLVVAVRAPLLAEARKALLEPLKRRYAPAPP